MKPTLKNWKEWIELVPVGIGMGIVIGIIIVSLWHLYLIQTTGHP